MSAGAVPNRARSTANKRSKQSEPLLAAERLENRGTGTFGMGNTRDRRVRPAGQTLPTPGSVFTKPADLGGAAHHVERGARTSGARGGDQVGGRRIFGNREVNGRVGRQLPRLVPRIDVRGRAIAVHGQPLSVKHAARDIDMA